MVKDLVRATVDRWRAGLYDDDKDELLVLFIPVLRVSDNYSPSPSKIQVFFRAGPWTANNIEGYKDLGCLWTSPSASAPKFTMTSQLCSLQSLG